MTRLEKLVVVSKELLKKGKFGDVEMFMRQIKTETERNRKMEADEKWDVKVTYEVKGKEVYTNTQEWKGIKPQKVGLMMKLLQEAQDKFVKEASSV